MYSPLTFLFLIGLQEKEGSNSYFALVFFKSKRVMYTHLCFQEDNLIILLRVLYLQEN